MKDFLGRTIKKGDRVAYARSNKNGGVTMSTHLVLGFTESRIIAPCKGTFGRDVQYLVPSNCVIYRTASEEEAMIRNVAGVIEHLEMFKEIQKEDEQNEDR